MPDYIVEVHSKSIYGPFTYPNPGALKADLTGGNLNLSEVALELDVCTRLTVKEVKPEK